MKDEKIGKNIRQYRISNGMTQKQLAERIGISPETLGKCERGQYGITLLMIIKLTSVFKIPADYLLFGRIRYLKNKPDDLTAAIDELDENERKKTRRLLDALKDRLD